MVRIFVRLEDEGIPRLASSLVAFAVMMVVVLLLAEVLSLTADKAALVWGKKSLYRRLGLSTSRV